MNERVFNPAEAHKLEDPERPKWLPPGEVLAALKVTPGMVVADIGAGTGYFAPPLADAVAPGGEVHAVDLQPEMLALLSFKLGSGGRKNIALVEGSTTHSSLPQQSCDLVLLANVWHELDDHRAALREARRILRPGGRVAILDWRPDVTRPPGPPLEHRIAAEDVVRLVEADGWKPRVNRCVGEYSYLLVFELS